MLKIQNVSTGYGKKQVLFDVSLEVKEGEIVLLAGSNGSGKSTLLKAIYGMLPLWHSNVFNQEVRGVIIFNGEIINNMQTFQLLRKGLLYIPQKNNLFEDLTVKENLEMAGLSLDQKTLKTQIEKVLSIFTIMVPYLNKMPMRLSGGERQILTLAMATLHQPKMILVDEPFIGLSPQNIALVTENLRVLNEKQEMTLLIVEHHLKACLQIAKRVLSLKFGKVFSDLEITENFNIKELNHVFL